MSKVNSSSPGGRWLVIFENGATNNLAALPGIETPEEAVRIAYEGIESSTALTRDKAVRVIAVLDLSRMDKLTYGLALWQLRLARMTPDEVKRFKDLRFS